MPVRNRAFRPPPNPPLTRKAFRGLRAHDAPGNERVGPGCAGHLFGITSTLDGVGGRSIVRYG